MADHELYEAPAQVARERLSKLIWAAFAALAALLLVTEQRAHALGWAVHVLLAICVVVVISYSAEISVP